MLNRPNKSTDKICRDDVLNEKLVDSVYHLTKHPDKHSASERLVFLSVQSLSE